MYFRSPIALSINEDDEENLEDVIENGNQNGGIEEEYELLPKPLNTKSRRLKRQVLYNSYSVSNLVVPQFYFKLFMQNSNSCQEILTPLCRNSEKSFMHNFEIETKN